MRTKLRTAHYGRGNLHNPAPVPLACASASAPRSSESRPVRSWRSCARPFSRLCLLCMPADASAAWASVSAEMVSHVGEEFPVLITSYETCMVDTDWLRARDRCIRSQPSPQPVRHHISGHSADTEWCCFLLLVPLLQTICWKFCVVDEAHRLKNSECKLLKKLKELQIDNKLLLSGGAGPAQRDAPRHLASPCGSQPQPRALGLTRPGPALPCACCRRRHSAAEFSPRALVAPPLLPSGAPALLVPPSRRVPSSLRRLSSPPASSRSTRSALSRSVRSPHTHLSI